MMSIFEQYRQYFNITNDAHAHFYEIAYSPYPSPIKNSQLSFGEDTYKIGIIDQFNGKRPFLFNMEFMRSPKRYELQIVVSIILDSHLVTELHAYCTNSEQMINHKKAAVESFLKWVSTYRYDFNPSFYFTESFCKSTLENFISSVSPVAASMLHLHAMDEEIYLRSGEIVPRKGSIEHYQDKYRAVSIEECAQKWLTEFINIELELFRPIIDATYASLLKMVLIHKMDRRHLFDKLSDFESFLSNELGARLARESLFAAYYFADLLGSMVGVQANTSYENAKKNLRATAWDILLLRIPELLLNPANLPEMNLAYVCTADKKLFEMGSLFELEMLAIRSDDTFGVMPAIEMNYAPFEKKVGRKLREKVFSISDKVKNNRLFKEKSKLLSGNHISFLIDDLEVQLRNLCRG